MNELLGSLVVRRLNEEAVARVGGDCDEQVLRRECFFLLVDWPRKHED